ncbi:MAG TPA: cytochrome c oxidase subunit 3 [Lacibacter sp.]|nr:cytochrome c oxidase subunit 3 [Lacibacter sp.]HMO88353.1 cytochrome c oxidase subunit 3 [Lacibacter sp.]HMP87479.1 cytochrome c oxidase subunit 3 [Lacibacter sp.]
MSERKQKMHPHKFTLWVAIGSITMMFAGFTSAYIVKSNMAGWVPVQMPQIFYLSTVLILGSSATIYLAQQAFRQRLMARYRLLITVTAVLGLAFLVTQFIGFSQLWEQKVTLKDSVAGAFFYIITGVHGLHVLGGVVALLVIFARAYSAQTRYYSSTPIEVAAVYWHFVDILWIYLFVFFLMVS